MGLVRCSQDLQTSFFNKTFITNESHNTIHTFKNYFVTVFSVFSKINDIQTYLSVKFKLYPHCFFLSHPICNIAVKNLEAPIPNAQNFFFGYKKMSINSSLIFQDELEVKKGYWWGNIRKCHFKIYKALGRFYLFLTFHKLD